MRLFCGGDEILLKFAVGVGVGGESHALVWVGDLEGVEGHAAAQLLAGLVKGERLTERREAVAEISEGLGGEVVAEIGREQTAIDLAMLKVMVDIESLLFDERWREFSNHGSREPRDG